MTIQKLNEADGPRTHRFMNARERALKKKLIQLLRDTHHNKYADRLERFDIRIIPLKVDPFYSASISFDEGVINIGEGFLVDDATFSQLNVIIRHELAHNLMMHQIRLARKLPKYNKLASSATMFDFLNIVADDEISNTRYTEADKEVIRHQKLNGREVVGLVTEDHREDWRHLSLEQMVEKLEKEIEEDNERLLQGQSPMDRMPRGKKDAWNPTTDALLNAYNAYQDINSPSIIRGDLGRFIAGGCSVQTPRGKMQWAEPYRQIAEHIYRVVPGLNLTDADIYDMLVKIARTKITQAITLFSGKDSLELYTPEEKYIAEEVLKKFRSEYGEWYTKVFEFLNTNNPYPPYIQTFWDSDMKN